jgi:phospholipase/carboxylesterase
LTHFPASPSSEADSVYPTILALHGRGSNERDLIGLTEYLPQNLLWISPRGPHKLGIDAYEWYRVKVIGKPDPDEVTSAIEKLDYFVDEILFTYPINPQKLFLLGFSQGSILSMCYALGRPFKTAGVIAQSGYIPQGVQLNIQEANVKDRPFIMTHGVQDSMIPVDWARASRNLLQNLGVYLSYYEFNMGHNVSAESLAVINLWLERQIQ